VEVPDGGKLAFVILQQGSAEVMYQSYASVEKDMPAILGDVRKGLWRVWRDFAGCSLR
jgi:hypothetical protein